MLSTELQGKIESLIIETFPDVFVVDINLTRGKYAVLSIKVDTDAGITLEKCMDVSRSVGRMLDEQDLMQSAYRLEVSSPGIGKPFKVRRQFPANIGRHVSVQTNDGQTFKGKLMEVTETNILLEPVSVSNKKKKKQASESEQSPHHIAFDDIQTAKVILA